jgi:thiamine-monophosphate kinase
MRRRGERELVLDLRRRFGRASPGVEVGIGDDAAVVRFESARQVVSTDLLVAGIDLPSGVDGAFLARKAMAANVSDLCASGARPTAALAAIGIPPSADDAEIDRFFDCLEAASRRWSCPVAGGDLSGAPVWTCSITVFGEPVGEPWLRRGATPGDELWWFGGAAGRAAAGLRLLLAGAEARLDGAVRLPAGWKTDSAAEEAAAEAVGAQLDPAPFVAAVELARNGGVTAAIDVSDGLALDAERLADASGVGFDIEIGRVPIFPIAGLDELLGRDPQGDALSGGEDFALLAAVRSGAAGLWPAALRDQGRLLGRVVPGSRVRFLDGGRELHPLRLGFDHFAPPGDRNG